MVGEATAAAFEAAAAAAPSEGTTPSDRNLSPPLKAALATLFTKVMECGDARSHAEALAARLAAVAGGGGEAALSGPDAIAYRLTQQCVVVGVVVMGGVQLSWERGAGGVSGGGVHDLAVLLSCMFFKRLRAVCR